MIHEVNGDLLKSDCDVILHQANCFHTMGTGIAKQIKDKFPFAYAADTETLYGDINKLGTYSMRGNGRIIVVNVYGQYRYGRLNRHTNYEALSRALESLNEKFKVWPKIPKVGIPFKIGCNNAGGDWDVVRAIIKASFKDIDVYIYKIGD